MKKIFLILIGILMMGTFVSAGTSYCCEKLTSGAWCQNEEKNLCDMNYRVTPTSCEATSYCKRGICVDSEEGTCMENSPQKVCEENEGVWYDNELDEVPQCNLGCCLIGDQAAFVTKTRCKRLSALYGLQTNFREDINGEVQCIAAATSDSKGACVFEKEYERTCLMITQRECSEMGGNETKFYSGRLCSDEKLNTNCGPSKKTTCVEGKDQVYFVDTCGNLANVYDASKINDKEYWANLKDVSEVCGYGSPNTGSASCGNCDYYLGSTCKEYKRSEDGLSAPTYGDNICHDLDCKWENQNYKHGETWCADNDADKNLPGSRYFRLVCYNGEVSVEPCADFRQEICIEDEVNGFKTAACRVNKWQICSSFSELNDTERAKKNCENAERGDCIWTEEDKCIPKFAPGFNFWEGGEAEEICSKASTTCTVEYEKKLTGDKKCVSGCECLENDWEKKMNEICVALGDCGSSVNYLGQKGFHDEEAIYSMKVEDEE
jgi:hypothetical protein